MSAYTPGPWEVVGNPDDGYNGRHKRTGETLLKRPRKDVALVRLRVSNVNHSAIAAQAPAMAEALREVAAFLKYVPGVHPTALADRVESILATIEGK